MKLVTGPAKFGGNSVLAASKKLAEVNRFLNKIPGGQFVKRGLPIVGEVANYLDVPEMLEQGVPQEQIDKRVYQNHLDQIAPYAVTGGAVGLGEAALSGTGLAAGALGGAAAGAALPLVGMGGYWLGRQADDAFGVGDYWRSALEGYGEPFQKAQAIQDQNTWETHRKANAIAKAKGQRIPYPNDGIDENFYKEYVGGNQPVEEPQAPQEPTIQGGFDSEAPAVSKLGGVDEPVEAPKLEDEIARQYAYNRPQQANVQVNNKVADRLQQYNQYTDDYNGPNPPSQVPIIDAPTAEDYGPLDVVPEQQQQVPESIYTSPGVASFLQGNALANQYLQQQTPVQQQAPVVNQAAPTAPINYITQDGVTKTPADIKVNPNNYIGYPETGEIVTPADYPGLDFGNGVANTTVAPQVNTVNPNGTPSVKQEVPQNVPVADSKTTPAQAQAVAQPTLEDKVVQSYVKPAKASNSNNGTGEPSYVNTSRELAKQADLPTNEKDRVDLIKQRILRGEYGNGRDNRKAAAVNDGFSEAEYNKAQADINKQFKKPKKAKVSPKAFLEPTTNTRPKGIPVNLNGGSNRPMTQADLYWYNNYVDSVTNTSPYYGNPLTRRR